MAKKLRTMELDIEELVQATSLDTGESERFLDLETGQIHWDVDSEIDDEPKGFARQLDRYPDRYEPIPCLSDSSSDYRRMCLFAESIDEEDIHDMLDVALRGRGAFSRFRDVISRFPDIEARWYRLLDADQLQETCDWLRSLGIEPVYERRTPRVPQPPAQP